MTPDNDTFITYDEFRGPEFDAARWTSARLPLSTGDEHVPLDPNAELAEPPSAPRSILEPFCQRNAILPAATSDDALPQGGKRHARVYECPIAGFKPFPHDGKKHARQLSAWLFRPS